MSFASLKIKSYFKTIPFKAWILATRPKTLLVSLTPIVVGTALASQQVKHLNVGLIFCVLLCSLFIQIGTNLVNDALDFKKGADTKDRIGPQRITQSGLSSFNQVLTVGCICFGMAFLSGLPLIMQGGWPFILLIAIAIACGYLYTGGPYPLAYLGISDIFILIFFGWVSTCTVYYLQTGFIDAQVFLAATQIGLLAIVPHAINNLRDHVSDALVNKKTFAVRFGVYATRIQISLLSLIPFILGLEWLREGKIGMGLLPFCLLPFIVKNLQAIWYTSPSSAHNQFLAKSALHSFLFGCLLSLGQWMT